MPQVAVIFRKRAANYKALLRTMKCKNMKTHRMPQVAVIFRLQLESFCPQKSLIIRGSFAKKISQFFRFFFRIFRKRAANYKALLRTMKCKNKASYMSSRPCMPKMQTETEWRKLNDTGRKTPQKKKIQKNPTSMRKTC